MSRFSGTIGAAHIPPSSCGTKRKRLSHLPGDSINPLSYPPAVLKQFRVAGLPSSEHLPSTTVPGFPHRSWRDAEETTDPDEQGSRSSNGGSGPLIPPTVAPTQKSSKARDELLGSLRECAQICLERGDLHRARKAMAALARAEGSLSQAHRDTARHHQWCLRAEFIMCEGESHRNQDLPREGAKKDQEAQPRVWSSGNNVPQLRAYLSTLISEHPKATTRPALARLLAMWRALLSAEMYSAYSEHSGTGSGQDGDAPDSESDPGSAAGTVTSEHSNSPWQTRGADEERQRDVDGETNRIRPEALKTMETVVEHLESLMNSKLYRSDHELLHLYAAALLYLADLLAQARSVSQIKQTDAQSREKAIRDRARAVLGHIIQLGGQIDRRLRYIIDAGVKGVGTTVE